MVGISKKIIHEKRSCDSQLEAEMKQMYKSRIGIIKMCLREIYSPSAGCCYELSERQILFLNGYLNILRRDLFYDYTLNQLSWSGDYWDKKHLLINIYPSELTGEMPYEEIGSYPLKGKCILSWYRKPNSICDQLKRVEEGEELSGGEYNLYKHLQVGYAGSNGHHRLISAAMTDYNFEGRTFIYDDSEAIETLLTDGGYWYIKNETSVPISKVSDYRIALIFTLTKAILQGSYYCLI